MKKAILSIFLLVTFSVTTYSQISWNAKAGINFSTDSGGDYDYKPGYQIGAGLEYQFNNKWSLQPSLMLITKGLKSSGEYLPEYGDGSFDIKENRMYLQLPILAAYRFSLNEGLNLVLSAGPYVAYGIGGKYTNKVTSEGKDIPTESNTFSDTYNRIDAGVNTGVTLEMNKFTVGVFGEYGLVKVANGKNISYGLNVGYKF